MGDPENHGCCGEDQKQAAKLELKVSVFVLDQLASNGDLRQLALDKAKSEIKDDPCRFIGRLGGGVATSQLLGSRFGKPGRAGALALSLAAASGDALYQCEKGLKLIEESFPNVYNNLNEAIDIFQDLPPEVQKEINKLNG